jgi:hypothetical protein
MLIPVPGKVNILPQKLCAYYLEWLLSSSKGLNLLIVLLIVRVVLHVAADQKCAQVIV